MRRLSQITRTQYSNTDHMNVPPKDRLNANRRSSLSDLLSKVLEILGVLLLGVILGLTLLQVVIREIPYSIVWTEELARFTLIILTFVGMPYAMKQQEDISLRQIIEKMPFRYWKPLFIFSNIMVIVLCVALVISVYSIVPRTINQRLVTFRFFAQGHAHIVLGIGSFLTILYAIEHTYELWQADEEADVVDDDTDEADDTTEVVP